MKNIQRHPDVIWREELEARDDVIAAMERGEDASTEGTVLLIVSGMMHELNLIGGEVWKHLDGRDEEEVVDELLKSYDVDRDVLAWDVHEFLEDIDSRGWITHE